MGVLGVVRVRVTGAVVKLGAHEVEAPARIGGAIEAAGGLARRARMWAAGPVRVRRRRGGGEVDAWEFHLDRRSEWESFELHENDLIVVQWHIADAKEVGGD